MRCLYVCHVVIVVSRHSLYVLVWMDRLLGVMLPWMVVAAVLSFVKMLRKVLRCGSQVPTLVAPVGQVSSARRGPAASVGRASVGLDGRASPAGTGGDPVRRLVVLVARPAHLTQDLVG